MVTQVKLVNNKILYISDSDWIMTDKEQYTRSSWAESGQLNEVKNQVTYIGHKHIVISR